MAAAAICGAWVPVRDHPADTLDIGRAFHEIPVRWRFHAIRHSIRTIDWLAGSRPLLLELVATR